MKSYIPKQKNKEFIDERFLSSPGEDLVNKLMFQMNKIKGFKELFGEFKSKEQQKSTDQQRWADYNRQDWSIRQLPAINIFESQSETKQAENGYITGNISIQVFWPANFRRSDLSRVPSAYKGAMLGFFSSDFCKDMLDELYYNQRPEKVYGLNELGKNLTWSPNVEGLVESELVPVTILEVQYRIDLRAWYRALEYMGRTKENPFAVTLDDLVGIDGVFQGIINNNPEPVLAEVEVEIEVTNP